MGLDDLILNDKKYFTHTETVNYTITLSTEGNPDTFDWEDSEGNSGSNIEITGGYQALSYGVEILFGATTGHTSGDQWEFHCGTTLTFSASGENIGIGKDPEYKLDVDGIINSNSNKIINVASPTNPGDVTNKNYVENNFISSTGDITFTGNNTFTGTNEFSEDVYTPNTVSTYNIFPDPLAFATTGWSHAGANILAQQVTGTEMSGSRYHNIAKLGVTTNSVYFIFILPALQSNLTNGYLDILLDSVDGILGTYPEGFYKIYIQDVDSGEDLPIAYGDNIIHTGSTKIKFTVKTTESTNYKLIIRIDPTKFAGHESDAFDIGLDNISITPKDMIASDNFWCSTVGTYTIAGTGDEKGNLIVTGDATLGSSSLDTINILGKTYYTKTPTSSGEITNKDYVDEQIATIPIDLQSVTDNGAETNNTLTLTNSGTGLIIDGDLIVKGTTTTVNITTVNQTISADLIIGDELTVKGNVTLGDQTSDRIDLIGKTYYTQTPSSSGEITNKQYVDDNIPVAGGSDTQIQFNDGGSELNGNSYLTFDKATNNLYVGGNIGLGITPVANQTLRMSGSGDYYGVSYSGTSITGTAMYYSGSGNGSSLKGIEGVVYYSGISGTAYGMFSQVSASAATDSTIYGNYSRVSSTGGTGLTLYGYYTIINGSASNCVNTYGARFDISENSSDTNYGIYATATNAATNWAGYFVEDVFIGGELNMNTNKIINVDTPTLSGDVATKQYVDDNSGGLPGGSNTQIQYNNNDVFGGSPNNTFTSATGVTYIKELSTGVRIASVSGGSNFINWRNGNNQVYTITSTATSFSWQNQYVGWFKFIVKHHSFDSTVTIATAGYWPGEEGTSAKTLFLGGGTTGFTEVNVFYDGTSYYYNNVQSSDNALESFGTIKTVTTEFSEYDNSNSTTIDWSKGDTQTLALDSNRTLTFTNQKTTTYILRVQHASSAYSLTFPTSYHVGTTGTSTKAYTLEAGTTKYTIFSIYYDGSNFWVSEIKFYV